MLSEQDKARIAEMVIEVIREDHVTKRKNELALATVTKERDRLVTELETAQANALEMADIARNAIALSDDADVTRDALTHAMKRVGQLERMFAKSKQLPTDDVSAAPTRKAGLDDAFRRAPINSQ
jgi:hypothetical protein